LHFKFSVYILFIIQRVANLFG